ncbi:hypothetical protein HOY34_08660 [Xinfangfangia sp. D13-10-4-6]|uniref:hypothetical protein n=1 Tax=Pseudogemmobacter hezensis TaxID=2737662 RepID=UPI00155329D6|nr:hypothetical protein [Pseudogemmobacter hezensis]NPD15269.1 hypothetical protein [Pseudogemmobacter hezensis]
MANEMVGNMAGLVLGAEVWELTVTDPVGPVVLPLAPVAGLVWVNGDDDVSGFILRVPF